MTAIEEKETISNEKECSLSRMVMDKIGKPNGFIKCVAKKVYDNRYRVNVWTEDGIPFSYFIIFEKGEIVYCNPKL